MSTSKKCWVKFMTVCCNWKIEHEPIKTRGGLQKQCFNMKQVHKLSLTNSRAEGQAAVVCWLQHSLPSWLDGRVNDGVVALSIVRPFHLILYSTTQTNVKCELMYSIYHAFVYAGTCSSFGVANLPALSLQPLREFRSVFRAMTQCFSTVRVS